MASAFLEEVRKEVSNQLHGGITIVGKCSSASHALLLVGGWENAADSVVMNLDTDTFPESEWHDTENLKNKNTLLQISNKDTCV